MKELQSFEKYNLFLSATDFGIDTNEFGTLFKGVICLRDFSIDLFRKGLFLARVQKITFMVD